MYRAVCLMREVFHLWKLKGRLNYSVRVPAPEDVLDLVVRSLGTADKRLAQRKLIEVLPSISRRIGEARRRRERLDLLFAETITDTAPSVVPCRRLIDLGDGAPVSPRPRRSVATKSPIQQSRSMNSEPS
jgi:hypothetical protein